MLASKNYDKYLFSLYAAFLKIRQISFARELFLNGSKPYFLYPLE